NGEHRKLGDARKKPVAYEHSTTCYPLGEMRATSGSTSRMHALRLTQWVMAHPTRESRRGSHGLRRMPLRSIHSCRSQACRRIRGLLIRHTDIVERVLYAPGHHSLSLHHPMATSLSKPLAREIDLGDQPYKVVISPEGVRLTRKGGRKGAELKWCAILALGQES